MLRKIRRNVARRNMELKGYKHFGKYAPVKATGRKKDEKSFFAREWKKFL